MPIDKQGQELSVLGRLCSLEALVLVMGGVSVAYGAVTGDWLKVLVGGGVVAASFFLLRLCRKGSSITKRENR